MPEDVDLQAEEKDHTNVHKDGEKRKEREKKKEEMELREIDQEDLLGIGIDGHKDPSTPIEKTISESKGNAYDDLLGIGMNDESPTPASSQTGFGFMDLAGNSGIAGGMQTTRVKQPTLEVGLNLL